MSKNFNINISGINPDFIKTIKTRYTKDVKITHDSKNKVIQIKINKKLHENFLLNSLDNFLCNLEYKTAEEIAPSWTFDERASSITSPNDVFSLTSREVLFLKMLLKSSQIITYKEMTQVLWNNSNNVSKNAMRLFTKNIKKKLPPNILKNIQNVGYQLLL